MRECGRRSAGRSRHWFLSAVAIAAVGAFCFWPVAHADPTEADQIVALLRSPAGEYRKEMAIDRLSKIDSDGARQALLDLADSTNERLALLALRTLCRVDSPAARNKVKAVFENTQRTNVVRAIAMTAYLRSQQGQGSTWTDVKGYVKQHAGSNQMLVGQYAAVKAKYWAQEVDND